MARRSLSFRSDPIALLCVLILALCCFSAHCDAVLSPLPSTPQFIHHVNTSVRMEHVLLLGDSITQQGYMSGWVSKVSDALVRRAHVINSGLSGYNTRWVLDVLNDPARRGAVVPAWLESPLFVTLLLGSNDLAHNGQGVPLDEFRDNLKLLVYQVLSELKPQGGVFIMTPPPINEDVWNAQRPDALRYYQGARVYRQAVLDAVDALREEYPKDVFAVDVHRAFLLYGNPNASEEEMDTYDPNGAWTSLYVPDGLHINSLGGQLFAATLLEAIRASPKGVEVLYNEKDAWPIPDRMDMMVEYNARHPAHP